MIRLTNNSTTIHHTIVLNNVSHGFKPLESKYFPDNQISEIEKHVDVLSNFEMENFAGLIIQRDVLDIVGKGQGVSKTTTETHGITVTEDFGIGDELFIHWISHPLMDRTQTPIINFGFSPVTSEVDKLVSAEISMLGTNGGVPIDGPPEIFNLTDLPVSDTAFIGGDITLAVPLSHISGTNHDVSLKLKRIAASSNDLIGDVALHHVFVDYFRYLV